MLMQSIVVALIIWASFLYEKPVRQVLHICSVLLELDSQRLRHIVKHSFSNESITASTFVLI